MSTAICDALHAYVVSCTGLAADRVIWDEGVGARPSAPYIALRLELEVLGLPWLAVTDNPTPTAGNEIVHTSTGPQRGELRLQCFGGDVAGDADPSSILSKIVRRSALPTPAAILDAADVAVLGWSAVTRVGKELGFATFEPRALLTLRISATFEEVETGTYIETIDGSGTVHP